MNKSILGVSAIFGALAIILGAFGAHQLQDQLEPEKMASFETGVRYMIYHVLAALIISNTPMISVKSKNFIGLCFVFGILLFSGSIFILSIDLVEAKRIWFVTPLGGILFILGWSTAAISFFKRPRV